VVKPLDEVYVAHNFPVSEQITKEVEAFKRDLLIMEYDEVEPIIKQPVLLDEEIEQAQPTSNKLQIVNDLEANGKIKNKLEKMAHF
jgi:hypothetical protein